jgi:hypothetical protein
MSKRNTPLFLLVALCATTMLMGAKKQGCGEGLDNRPGEAGIDVGGTLGATWDLQCGGSTHEQLPHSVFLA